MIFGEVLNDGQPFTHPGYGFNPISIGPLWILN